MKKILLILCCLLPIFLLCQSNQPEITYSTNSFESKSNYLNINYGFIDLYKKDLNKLSSEVKNSNNFASSFPLNNVTYDIKSLGPIFFKYEYGLSDDIGIGLTYRYYLANFTETYIYSETTNYNSRIEYKDIGNYKITKNALAARLNYHFINEKKIDLFLGFSLGYSVLQYEYSYSSTKPQHVPIQRFEFSEFPLYIGLNLGMRYYIDKNFGINFEVGYENQSIIQTGLVIKI